MTAVTTTNIAEVTMSEMTSIFLFYLRSQYMSTILAVLYVENKRGHMTKNIFVFKFLYKVVPTCTLFGKWKERFLRPFMDIKNIEFRILDRKVICQNRLSHPTSSISSKLS